MGSIQSTIARWKQNYFLLLSVSQLQDLPKAGPNGYNTKNYFQYTNVAAPDIFEWGYRRGNDPHHFREEYLSQKAHNFKAKVRWGDSYEGQGEHFYDINHSGPVYKPGPA